jgi:hypothetical protein
VFSFGLYIALDAVLFLGELSFACFEPMLWRSDACMVVGKSLNQCWLKLYAFNLALGLKWTVEIKSHEVGLSAV